MGYFLEDLLEIDINLIDYENLDNNKLAIELQNVLLSKDAVLLPHRISNHYDLEQIIMNVVNKALVIFDKKLSDIENSRIRDELIEKYVRETGLSKSQIIEELSLVTERVTNNEGRIMALNQEMDNVQKLLVKL